MVRVGCGGPGRVSVAVVVVVAFSLFATVWLEAVAAELLRWAEPVGELPCEEAVDGVE